MNSLASPNELIEQIKTGAYDSFFAKRYPIKNDAVALAVQRERWISLLNTLTEKGAGNGVILTSTPGRTELGGNHTDHNHGIILAGSVHLDVAVAASPRTDNKVEIFSEGYDPIILNLEDLKPKPEETGTSEALVRGVAAWFRDHGHVSGGFTAIVHSMVPSGSGLSSSAAFEVAIAQVLNQLYNQGSVETVALASAGQFAENRFFGKPSGLMDQLACAHGGIIKVDFSRPEEPEIEAVHADFLKAGYFFGVIDSGGSHADLIGDYASIPHEMKHVAEFFGKSVLAELDRDEFFARLPEIRNVNTIPHRALTRAMHFYAENERVGKMYDMIQQGSYSSYLGEVRRSGLSSAVLLQNSYPQLEIARRDLAVIMAALQEQFPDDAVIRVHGGGFEGSIQFYVQIDAAEAFFEEVRRLCGDNSLELLHISSQGSIRLPDPAV